MLIRRIKVASALAIIASVTAPAIAQLQPTTQITGYATVASDARSRGLSQLYDDGTAVEIGIDFEFPSRLFAGGSISNVSYATVYTFAQPQEHLVKLYAGYGWTGAAWSAGASLGHYRYPDTSFDYDYSDLTFVVGYRDRFFYDLSITDDLLSLSRTAIHHELGVTWPLPGNVEVSATLGEFQSRGSEPSYTHYNVGVTKLVGPFSLDLRHYETSREVISHLGSSAEENWVLSVSYAINLRD